MAGVIATSDWHLDASTAGVDRYEDTCGAIDASVEAAKVLQAEVYIMGGDLTDPNTVRSHRAVTKAMQVQHECAAAGIEPVFIAGNHDVIEDGSGITTLSPLRETGIGYVFERPRVAQLKCGIVVIALPFTSLSHEYSPTEFIETCEVPDGPLLILGHLNLEGISVGSETKDMPRGRDVFWPIEAIEARFPNALLVGGHYPAPQEYKGVHIIGSTARLRFDEVDNENGFLVVEV